MDDGGDASALIEVGASREHGCHLARGGADDAECAAVSAHDRLRETGDAGELQLMQRLTELISAS